MRLGADFERALAEPEAQHQSQDAEVAERVAAAIDELRDALTVLTNQPAPQVTVQPAEVRVDTTGLEAALGQMSRAPTLDEIGRVMAEIVGRIQPDIDLSELVELRKTLETLDFRLKGIGGGGGGGPSSVAINNAPQVKVTDSSGGAFTSSNRLPVDVGGSINVTNLTTTYESVDSTANASDTPLGSNATFEGAWEDVRDFASITVTVLTDQPSAANGAVIQFTDDVNVGTVMRSVATTIPANVATGGTFFSLAPQGRFFRIRYTNGATAQTTFRSQVLLKFSPVTEPTQPLGATITDANTAAVSRAHLTARQATGQWTSLLTNASGHLSTRVENQPAEYPLPASQVSSLTPQTNALTDSQLRATPVAVSGTVTATGPLTDAQLRATPVPVSGTVTTADPVSPFARLLKFEPLAGEEIRRDETVTDDYHGAAPDGTATSAASWRVARFYKSAGLITRVRYRTGVVWDNRTAGW